MLLYFLPSQSPAAAPAYCATSREVRGGPGTLDGTIWSDGTGKTGYYPDEQTWVELADFWLGVDAAAVDPQGLQHPELVDGHRVLLEDGSEWLIPVARAFPAGTRLPESLVLGPKGELVSEILPRFAAFAAQAELAYDFFCGGSDLLQTEAWEIATAALAINYQLGPQEVSALRLLTSVNIAEVLKAIIDMPTIEIAAKKKAAEPLGNDNLSDGGGD